MTAEGKMPQGLLARLEFRRDWSDHDFFDRGGTPSAQRPKPRSPSGSSRSSGRSAEAKMCL